MGVFKRKGSRYYWMSHTVSGIQIRKSTKTTTKEVAARIWKHRQAEIALGMFRVGWPGEQMNFEDLLEEYRTSHVSCLSESSQEAFENHKNHLVRFFGRRVLAGIDTKMIEQYKATRRQQPSRNNPERTVKGATVNRELETLQCMFKLAVRRRYIKDNPASAVEHFPELRDRPAKRLITPEEFLRILNAAPMHLRVGIILLEQTGNRTYSELFSLKWEEIDLDEGLVCFRRTLKTHESSSPEPLSGLACKVLRWWKEQSDTTSPFVFPSPWDPSMPIRTVKTAWHRTLKRAGVPYFPIYQLRHAFCTRLSKVAPDAVVQRAMRHSSPETKRFYQLGMVKEVREAMDEGNQKFYGYLEYHIFSTVTSGKPLPTAEPGLQVLEA